MAEKRLTQLKSARSAGRPRTLMLNDVLDAAAEIGLDQLSMTAVASRLSVGIATLYTYVDGVDELRRLVAVRAAHRPLLQDCDQHWSAIVETYTRALYDVFAAEPRMITQFVEGGLGAEGLVDELENFLKLMTRRGFDVPLAMRVFRLCGSIALGAATAVSNAAGLTARGMPPARAIWRDFADHDPATVPILSTWLGTFVQQDIEQLIDDDIALLLQSLAALRGETLPGPHRNGEGDGNGDES